MNAPAAAPLTDMPGPPILPVIGSLPWMLGAEGVNQRLLVLAGQHRAAGLFRIVAPGGDDPIFVTSARLAEALFDEKRFQKAVEGPLITIREFTGDGLFTARADEPAWGVAHRVVSPGFTSDAMERFLPAMRQVLGALLDSWRRAEGPVDVVADMTKLTLDTISLCGFGFDFHSFEQPALHPFLQALARALQESMDRIIRPKALGFLFTSKARRFRDDVAEMRAHVDGVIAARRAQPASSWPEDLLSLMLTESDPKTGARLSDENIRYQVLTFLVAGHETTAGLLAFTLHQLAMNPSVLEKVRAEVEAVIGDGVPTRAQELKLSYVMRTLSEALRLWPTVPVLTLAPLADEEIAGFQVPAGRPINVLVSAIHRDPDVWAEPERFDPDRFLPEAARARPASAYKPFGNGKRSCTGRIFALTEAALAVALIVREFDFTANGPLRIAPTTSPKPRGLTLTVRPRPARSSDER
jgi:cytochrome P450/NADPH-cytochrome P450 reductase